MGHEVLNLLGGVGARVEVRVCGGINNTKYLLKKNHIETCSYKSFHTIYVYA